MFSEFNNTLEFTFEKIYLLIITEEKKKKNLPIYCSNGCFVVAHDYVLE